MAHSTYKGVYEEITHAILFHAANTQFPQSYSLFRQWFLRCPVLLIRRLDMTRKEYSQNCTYSMSNMSQ